MINEYDLKSGDKHSYHVVNVSPWPLMGALSAGILAAGSVLYFHEIEIAGAPAGLKAIIPGFLGVLLTMFFWWKDVVREAIEDRAHTSNVKVGLRMGMKLFIVSEVMFFFAFFWAFFNASLFPTEAIGGAWPPPNIHVIDPFKLPFLMTMILLLSGCTCSWAHHEITKGNQKQASKAIFLTVLLGWIFLVFQAYEYHHASFGFADSVYSSVFYMATGFHGLHVLIGSIFLFVCWRRSVKGHFTPNAHVGFESAAWYWHFVDVVWLFLFCAIYWWGGS